MDSLMSDDERRMIELKYSSPRIASLDPKQIENWAMALLLKIHVITGWTIPEQREIRNILVDQFGKILQEKYYDLNVEEIEYAFRSRGTVVEDWGKNFNMNLLDKVLLPYANERYKISEAERQIKQGPPPGSNFFRMINEDYKMFCGIHKHIFTGKGFFPERYYDILEESKAFEKDFYLRRLEMYLKKFPNVAEDKLVEIAKERCVLQVFRKARKLGFDILFTSTTK